MNFLPRLLVVEDEPAVSSVIERMLSSDGYIVDIARNGREAKRRLEDAYYSLAIVDISLPDIDGPALIRQMVAESPMLGVIAISGYMAGALEIMALTAGAKSTLQKPFSSSALKTEVYRLLDPSCSWMGASESESAPEMPETGADIAGSVSAEQCFVSPGMPEKDVPTGKKRPRTVSLLAAAKCVGRRSLPPAGLKRKRSVR